MKISNNGGREQNNVMFIDALWSIAPHRAKYKIQNIVQNAKQQLAKQQNRKTAKLQ